MFLTRPVVLRSQKARIGARQAQKGGRSAEGVLVDVKQFNAATNGLLVGLLISAACWMSALEKRVCDLEAAGRKKPPVEDPHLAGGNRGR